jgi:hypothetical protein
MNAPDEEAADRLRLLEEHLVGRISRLERAGRSRRWTTGLLVAGLVGSLSLSGAIIFDPALVRGLSELGTDVRAHRFALEDEDGNVRGLWQLDEDGAVRLSIHDPDGRARMNLSVLGDGSPGISLADDRDRRRVVLGLLPDQTGTLVFADGGGVPRAILGVSDNGSANLVFGDGDGVSRVSLGLDASGDGGLMLPESAEEGSPGADEQ